MVRPDEVKKPLPLEKSLGQLGMDRIAVLQTLRIDHNRSNQLEHLREIEKAMVAKGWDGEAYIVRPTKRGPVLLPDNWFNRLGRTTMNVKGLGGHFITVTRFKVHSTLEDLLPFTWNPGKIIRVSGFGLAGRGPQVEKKKR